MAGEEPMYTDWLRHQPCARCGKHGQSQAHHATGHGKGLGQRNHDRMAFGLCHDCHRLVHDKSLGMTRDALREWQDAKVDEARCAWSEANMAEQESYDDIF